MSSGADDQLTYNWTTLRYLADPQREITVPMGVILWSEDQQRLWFRLPVEGEGIAAASGCDDVPVVQARTYLEITRAKLEGWLQLGEVPYQTELHPPLSGGWWEQVRRHLQWRVRLGSIQSLVSCNPAADLERLYQAVVQPLPPALEAAARPEPVPEAPVAD